MSSTDATTTTTASATSIFEGLRILALPDKKCLKKFQCGVGEIDRWASARCAKWQAKSRSRTFCAHLKGAPVAAGFYSLSFSAEDASCAEKDDQSIYSQSGVPLIYIQYLAVSRPLQNQGLGTILLIDALKRAHRVSTDVAIYGVALRSLNERSTKLYFRYGFVVREERPCPLMILPVWHLISLFQPPAADKLTSG